MFVLVSHSHHKTSRLWTLAQDIISEWEQRKKRRVGGGAPCESRKTVTLILFYLLFFLLSCEEANAASAPGVPDRRAVDGSPCKSHKTHALVPVSCFFCPMTFQTHCRRFWTVCSRILWGSRSCMCQRQRSWWKSWSLSLTGVRRQHKWTCIFR